MKVVHFNLYDGTGLFSDKRDHVEYQAISCDMHENCDFHKKQRCAAVGGLSSCPYASYQRRVGPTRRARSCREWISKARETYAGVPYLNPAQDDSVYLVGEHVYLPLQFLDNYVNPFKTIPMKFKHFVLRKDLTADVLVKFIKFRPRALFGGEILDYQKKHVPALLRGLKERLPELVPAILALEPSLAERFGATTNVGRLARLDTLTPNVGTFADIHGGLWRWDGTELHSDNSRVSFTIVKFTSVRIMPAAGVGVKVTDDAQVNEGTVFL